MAKDYLIQVVFPHSNALPRNAVINTFSFRGPDIITEPDRTALIARLTQFFNAINAPGTSRLTTWMSAQMAVPLARIKAYRRDDPLPRAPIFDEPVPAWASAGASAAPHELAACLSFHAPKLSGVPQARRRGRIFFGPVGATGFTSEGGDGRVAVGLQNALIGAGRRLRDDTDAIWQWGVWSKFDGHATVTGGWVDNAMDIQRRRGLTATTRTLL